MCGAIPPLPQYDFMAWCLVKTQGKPYLYLLFVKYRRILEYETYLFERHEIPSVSGLRFNF